MRIWNKKEIETLIKNNDVFVIRCMEQLTSFEAVGAKFAHSIASRNYMGRHISQKQMNIAREIALDYISLFTKIANKEIKRSNLFKKSSIKKAAI